MDYSCEHVSGEWAGWSQAWQVKLQLTITCSLVLAKGYPAPREVQEGKHASALGLEPTASGGRIVASAICDSHILSPIPLTGSCLCPT